jgi:hypothetical protein
MEILALSSAPLGVLLINAALRTDLARAVAPALFALALGSLIVAYVAATEERLLGLFAAVSGAAIAGAGLIAVILTIDARLAAKGTANAGPTALRPALALGGTRRWREFEQHFWAHVDAQDWASARLSGLRPGAAVAEALYAFQRRGRAALFVFLRRDAAGRVLEAAAYDPEDYP